MPPPTAATPSPSTCGGSGSTVVFVPGAGPHRAIDPSTTRTAELVAARGLTTVVPDRLGRGESIAGGRLDLWRELSMLRAVIDAAGGHAVLVGHSSGCAISLAAAAAGLAVDGLVLWEAPTGMDGDDVRTWIGEFTRRLDGGDLDGALAHYMNDMPPEHAGGGRRDRRRRPARSFGDRARDAYPARGRSGSGGVSTRALSAVRCAQRSPKRPAPTVPGEAAGAPRAAAGRTARRGSRALGRGRAPAGTSGPRSRAARGWVR